MDDMLELSLYLKREHLFITTEKEQIQKVYEDVRSKANNLFHAAWVARQQTLLLEEMLKHGPGVNVEEICARHNQLESLRLIDGYKHLLYHDVKYGELLKFLRRNPLLLAQCFNVTETVNDVNIRQLSNIVISSLYGNCILMEDEGFVLQIVKSLIDIQLADDSSPRRLFRKDRCAFSIVFKQFTDCLFSTRLFLTAALHDPIMRLLMEDEWFYDIDPEKALIRFPPKERLKRFGPPDSPDHEKKLNDYRKFIVDKLVLLSKRFVQSINSNLRCFPKSLTWIISYVYQTLDKSGRFDLAEIKATCADLVFALLICPAICDPEPYGITTGVPISHIARHNLMQMAQIIQILAVSSWEDINENVQDIYSKFEKGCMSRFVSELLSKDIKNFPSFSPVVSLRQSSVLIAPTQLNHLKSFLKTSVEKLDGQTASVIQVKELLSVIPEMVSNLSLGACDSKSVNYGGMSNETTGFSTVLQNKELKALKKKNTNSSASDSQSSNVGTDAVSDIFSVPPEHILVIQLTSLHSCPGMVSENKVLSWDKDTNIKKVKSTEKDKFVRSANRTPVVEIHEKRTRFSLSHDQESIGNASDYQEVISEAASSHSVDNDDEIDRALEENDNLSDNVSVNVSGRDSPIFSGRDTPLSQAGSVEERNISELNVRVPVTVRKQGREDVTDRFGKFEIKAEYEKDETKSTVSDTWSTDVLASDSEPPEQNQLERLVEVVEDISIPSLGHSVDTDTTFPPSEISETASDAWSTDVLASDTEEKQSEILVDIDQDYASGIPKGTKGVFFGFGEGDITPQASGGQSPADGWDLSKLEHRNTNTKLYDNGLNNLVNNIQVTPYTNQPLIPNIDNKSNLSDVFVDNTDFQEPLIDIEPTFDPENSSNDSSNNVNKTASYTGPLEKQQSDTSFDSSFDDKRLSAALSLFDSNYLNEKSDILPGSYPEFQQLAGKQTAPLLCVSKPVNSTTESEDGNLINIGPTYSITPEVKDADDENQQVLVTVDDTGKSSENRGSDISLDFKDLEIDAKSEKHMKKGGLLKSLKDKIHTSMKKRGTKYEEQLSGGSNQEEEGTEDQRSRPEESLDEMLNKYRKKKEPGEIVRDPVSDPKKPDNASLPPVKPAEVMQQLYYDPNDLENCLAFQDAKRKLRIVLCIGHFQLLSSCNSLCGDLRQETDLVSLLRAQLAEAINLQNKGLIAQLHEVIRCVRLFDSNGVQKLLQGLREEYKSRSGYISYLVRCRQGLLINLSHLQKLMDRTQRHKDIGTKHLVNTCTSLYLESFEKEIINFYSDFQKLNMSDEKTDALENFLDYIYGEMVKNPIWTAATEGQLEDARLTIERTIMSRIYTNALFPNVDGDISRDHVFHQHIKKLSQVITPTHRDLCIPRIYHFECPWPAAQREIFLINAYKTPKDKLGCVYRCSSTIMNLLSMANEKSVPAADDFIPVLIYVIIQANPPCLLSTLQYVSSFYGNRLAGEESYWWSQFTSAVEFIKTMDYSE